MQLSGKICRTGSRLISPTWAGLLLLLEAYEPIPRPVHLVYDKRNQLPLKLRAFVDFAVPRLRDRLKAAAL